MSEPSHGPEQQTTQRSRFAAVIFLVVLAGAVLAVIPPVAVLGWLICVLAVVPAAIAYWRVRRHRAANRGQALAALIVAPVFFVVSSVVVGLTATPTPVPAEHTTALPSPIAVAPPPAPVVAPLVPAPAPAPASPAPVVVPAAAAPVTAPPPPVPAAAVAASNPAPAAVPAPAPSASCDESTSYINSNGVCVHRPVAAPSAPAGATAQCNDGTYSFSRHRQGTCSGHHGVATWL